MANDQNNTSNSKQAVINEFNTFMSLREKGVDKDKAFRAADHVRRATNEGGEKGAMTAAAQILLWLGAGLLVIVLVIGCTQYASANVITLPVVSSDCRYRCSSSVPMPTITPTAIVGVPPVPMAIVTVEVQ